VDAKLDAKRLEELATWAKCQERALIANEITDVAGYFADLARCAKAWAKVERMKTEPYRWALNQAFGLCLLHYGTDLHPTAIAAVEAAQEVTDANKG
jgi:hypothetical protein